MTDIVQRLRLIDPNQVLLAPPPHDTSYLQAGLICHEAAAEIERLRAEVLAEREACAKVCEVHGSMLRTCVWVAEECAGLIRKRGEP